MTKKSEKIKFYILVPVYNTEKFIEKCLNSILNQNYDNFKLIIVDDGTPDNAGVICDSFAKKDSRIDVIHKSNEGIISARQAAVHKAFEYEKNNENYDDCYVMFVDSDDYLLDGAMELIANNIDAYKSDMYIYNYEFSNYFGKTNFKRETPIYNLSNKREVYRKVIIGSYYNNLWRKVVSMKLLKNFDYTNYFRFQIGEDLLISLNLYKNANTITFLNDKIYFYNYNRNSIIRNKYSLKCNNRFELSEIVYDFIIKEDVFNQTDLEEFEEKEIKRLYNEILWIIDLNIKRSKKRTAIKKLFEEPFCKKIISQSNKVYFFTLIYNDYFFDLIYIVIFLRNKLAFIYHLIVG